MKLKFICGALLVGSNAQDPTDERAPEDERRYKQLADMMEFFNPDFDERKYWTYGCNCHVLGDRPMSDPGFGPPIDALDVVCKQYKDCQKCARLRFGDECIGEFVKYNYELVGPPKTGKAVCKNKTDGKGDKGDENRCKRALCECDAQFAKAHDAVKDVFDKQYHTFWSSMDAGAAWDPAAGDGCLAAGNGPVDHKCCGVVDGPHTIFNSNKKDCCLNGEVRDQGTCGKQKPGYWIGGPQNARNR